MLPRTTRFEYHGSRVLVTVYTLPERMPEGHNFSFQSHKIRNGHAARDVRDWLLTARSLLVPTGTAQTRPY
jgi:hypothetical protein